MCVYTDRYICDVRIGERVHDLFSLLVVYLDVVSDVAATSFAIRDVAAISYTKQKPVANIYTL